MHRFQRTRRSRRWLVIPALALSVIAGTTASASAAGSVPAVPPPKVQDVAGLTGLAAPFGVDVAADGSLVVAEAGAPADPSSGFPGIAPSIIKARNGKVTTLKTFDVGGDLTDVATGIFGTTFYTENNRLGRLAIGPFPEQSTDLSTIETQHNPDGGQTYGPSEPIPAECLAQVPASQIGSIQPYKGIVESHIYSVNTSLFAGLLVADAAGNDVHQVAYDGSIINTWVLPGRPEVVTQEGIDNINSELPPDQQLPSCLAGTTLHG